MTDPTSSAVPTPNPPPTPWIVEPSAEKVELRDNRAEVTFTVKNQQATRQRAVFEIVPGDAVAASWFAIEGERQRPIEANQSSQFKVTVTAPAGTPVASYWFQARVYAADVAPEESSTLSNRVTFAVAQPTDAPKKPFPWWIIAIVVAVVLVVGVVAFLLTRSNGPAVVPAVKDKVQAEAIQELNDAGFETVKVVNVQSPGVPAGVALGTVPPEGSTAETGDEIVLRVTIDLAKPTLAAPPNATKFAASTTVVGLAWNPVPGATNYSLTVIRPPCVGRPDLQTVAPVEAVDQKTTAPMSLPDGVPFVVSKEEIIQNQNTLVAICGFTLDVPFEPVTVVVDGTSTEVPLDTNGQQTLAQWSVAARDDEGNEGPRSEVRQFSFVP